MKVIFIGNETVDVSAIQSASVVFDDKRFEVCVKHKAEDTGEEKFRILLAIAFILTKRGLT